MMVINTFKKYLTQKRMERGRGKEEGVGWRWWWGSIQFFQRGFSKNVFSRGKVKPTFFVTFNTIASHNFPENFIEIPQVVQKIWRFYPSTLTIFVDFSDFLTFLCWKEPNDISV